MTDSADEIARIIASNISCERDCQNSPTGCGCSYRAADALQRLVRVDEALARQLSRSIMENARLHARIRELEQGASHG